MTEEEKLFFIAENEGKLEELTNNVKKRNEFEAGVWFGALNFNLDSIETQKILKDETKSRLTSEEHEWLTKLVKRSMT